MLINGISGNEPVQQTSSQYIEPDEWSEAALIEQLNKGRSVQQVTTQDAVNAFNLRTSDCVKMLLAKSPVGECYPSTFQIAAKGYEIVYHTESDGSYKMPAASGSGRVIFKPEAEDGTKTIVYRNEGFEQVMQYDNDGKLISADFKLKDVDTGCTYGTAHMFIDENGKKYYSE